MVDENPLVIPRRLINPEREETPRSLLDLIEQGPFDLDTAAWWMSHASKGASWIVGSGPGGIGKSTTMRSFLSVVPGDHPFAIAMPGEIEELGDLEYRVSSGNWRSIDRDASTPPGG